MRFCTPSGGGPISRSLSTRSAMVFRFGTIVKTSPTFRIVTSTFGPSATSFGSRRAPLLPLLTVLLSTSIIAGCLRRVYTRISASDQTGEGARRVGVAALAHAAGAVGEAAALDPRRPRPGQR